VDAAIGTTGEDTEIILINNHPPYQEVQDFLAKPMHPRVTVLDPGRNLGCHQGVHFGFRTGKGRFLVKLDDDIVLPRTGWTSAMRQALLDFPQLAYVSLPWLPIRTGLYRTVSRRDYRLELFPTRIYSSCLMMRKALWAQHFAVVRSSGLYATIEGEYYAISSHLGMERGYLVSHPVKHLGRTEQADLLYGVWKILYAKGKTREDFTCWRQGFTITPAEFAFLKGWGYPEGQLEAIKVEAQKLWAR